MKQAASPSYLLDRSTPWLMWWQELILNWVASWRTVGVIAVVSPDGEHEMTWSVPDDVEMQRMQLEELYREP